MHQDVTEESKEHNLKVARMLRRLMLSNVRLPVAGLPARRILSRACG